MLRDFSFLRFLTFPDAVIVIQVLCLKRDFIFVFFFSTISVQL